MKKIIFTFLLISKVLPSVNAVQKKASVLKVQYSNAEYSKANTALFSGNY